MEYVLILKDEEAFEKEHCCDDMTEQANLSYPNAESPLLGSTDKRIYWSVVYNEYGLICQPSSEILLIEYCPFCGEKLPKSKRDEWFARLEETGWESWGDQIPSKFLTKDWKNA